jgi:acetoin utilization protein AcuB
MPDVPGSLERASGAIKPSNIVSVATAGQSDGKRQFVMRVTGDGVDDVLARLRDAGIDAVEQA